jgi:DNA mismatch repair ATPase MutS
MSFVSILFNDSASYAAARSNAAPDYFVDLHLDQIIESITAGRDQYQLRPFFYTPLSSLAAIEYRQEVMRDLESLELSESLSAFAGQMRGIRVRLEQAGKRHHPYFKQREILGAIDAYCRSIQALGGDLACVLVQSRGFLEFREYLTTYRHSAGFIALSTETRALLTALNDIRYRLDIDGSRIKVSRSAGDADYGAEVLGAFAKFRGSVSSYHRYDVPAGPTLNPLDEVIIDLVAKLYPAQFAQLRGFCTRHQEFLDAAIRTFDCEIQFYLSYLEHVSCLKRSGLCFCYPTVTESKATYGFGIFDLALASQLVRDNRAPVLNDFYLTGHERVIIVSGANQGGKTTFARTLGQLHHLASLGCPVPALSARLFLFDRIYTHFEREEDLQAFTSKLEGDLLRIRDILQSATSRSLIIMNESFSSTTLDDALFLSRKVLMQIIDRDMLAVSVTFFDELADLGDSLISMVGTVDAEKPAQRTFRIIRKPADGLAYALAIAEKYHLTYVSLKTRLAPLGS